jgi:Protein kinase domain
MKGQMKSALMEMSLKETDYERKSEFEKDFKFNRKLKDPRFGEVSLIQNPKTRQFLAVKEKRINDKKEAGKAIINARKRLTNKHPNILSLLDYSVTKQSELCSSFYVLKLFYEFPRSDLHRENQERAKKGEGFSDIELTHILYQQIAANNYLQSKDQHHGDIQPLNVAYDRPNMNSQLIDMSEDASTANQSKQVQKNRVVAGHPLYQSPVTYSNLKKGNLNYNVDPNKEDVYALGLSLLEVGNGKSIQNIYNANTKEVDQQALANHVDEFKRRHGNENTLLTTTVETMVHPDEAQRPNFRDLESKLPPYATVQQFLKDRQENKVHGALMNQEAPRIQAPPQPVVRAQDDDWNFGNTGNFDYVTPHHVQSNPDFIPLVEMPSSFVSQRQHNVQTFDNFGFQNTNQHKVQSAVEAYPMVAPVSERKVVLLNENNNTQPSYNQSNQNVQTITYEPVIRRSYVVQDQSVSYPTSQQNVTTSYLNNSVSYTNPDASYNYSVNSQPRVEYVTLEPEYRREYITADRKVETLTQPVTQSYIKKDYVDVQTNYVTPVTTITQTVPQTEVKTVTYNAPETQTVTYTNVEPIRRSFVTYDSKPTNYTTTEVRRSYVAPQRIEYQNGYTLPQETVVKRVSYRAPAETQYVSERVIENPVVYSSDRYVDTKVVGNRYEDHQTETSGLKLIRTYQDNTNSTRLM